MSPISREAIDPVPLSRRLELRLHHQKAKREFGATPSAADAKLTKLRYQAFDSEPPTSAACCATSGRGHLGDIPQAEMANKVVDQVELDHVGHVRHALLIAE